MTELLTATQMRAIEQAEMAAGRAEGLALMERAGEGVVEAMLETWPELVLGPHRAIVVAGPGNNGGDGFVVARLLYERGWEIAVYFAGTAEHLPPDARTNFDRWSALGPVMPYDDADFAPEGAAEAVLVDALFGTGLTRAVTGFDAFARRARASRHVVAVDIASGLDADSGRYLEPDPAIPGHVTLRADLTVTFHRAKLGHVLAEGPAASGRVVVKDIGLPQRADPAIARRVEAPAPGRLAKGQGGHKYDSGHALVLAGGAGHGGAARMAARAALRIGAGLVTLAPPPEALVENAAQLTAVMLAPLADPAGLVRLLQDRRFNALALGPGLGLARARALVPAALSAKRATLLDADALSAFADEPQTLFGLLHEGCVLTPHGGEFARLFPDIAARLDAPPLRGPAFSRLDATREAAARAGCVVLLKGPDTVIADPAGRAMIHSAAGPRAAPWLATAGAGDVLTGLITGLLARGFAPLDAAATGAWLHVEAARRFGPGLIAEDLPDQIPGVLRDLGL